MAILLWPMGQVQRMKRLTPARTCEDLQLDRICGAMTFNNYYKLSVQELLRLWTDDVDVIRYRQAVLQDFLDNPDLASVMESLLDAIDTWESHSGRIGRNTEDKNLALDLWDFTFLDSYLHKVKTLCDALEHMKLSSEGMLAFREKMMDLATSSRFNAVRNAFERDCGGVNYPTRITIGFNLNHQLKPVSLKLMKIPEKGEKGRKMSLTPSAVQTTHQILGKAIGDAGRSISAYVRMESADLRGVKQDIVFYLSALHLRDSWMKLGLNSTIPEISAVGDQFFEAKEMFSPLLVIHGSEKVVTNDISFREGGELLVLTGANQGGKTVFLHAVALTQWLAQLGVMVPCKYARISPAAQILTVFAPNVNSGATGKGMGLLSEEAGRISEAVNALSENSMVFFNEPLNATSPTENLFISREVIGAFKAAGARGIWVTHLYELASDRERINELIPWGSCLGSIRIVVETDDSGTHSTYRIVRGEPEFKSYAAEVMRRKGI